MNDFRLKVFNRASLCHHFEEETFKQMQQKNIKFPTYLSSGQEFISSTIAQIMEDKKIEPAIFIQHRGHSTYLAFEGNVTELIDELLGRESGCANGMGGSASIQCKDKKIYGHDGLMGSQVPIAVGHCFSTRKPTIVFVGDSAAEEDYVLSAIGWAVTKNLPILFVVEDNNLSILTKKKIRRSWEMDNVAKGFGMINAYNISDDPMTIRTYIKDVFDGPMLLNINTHRRYWHAGPGCDDENIFDRYAKELSELENKGKLIDVKNKKLVEELWKKQLEIQ
jgi:pyruvate dehydrogenase E1 component alpha subunit